MIQPNNTNEDLDPTSWDTPEGEADPEYRPGQEDEVEPQPDPEFMKPTLENTEEDLERMQKLMPWTNI